MRDGVNGANLQSFRADSVQKGDHFFFIGNGHAYSRKGQNADSAHEIRKVIWFYFPFEITPVHAEPFKSLVMKIGLNECPRGYPSTP
jgi:hypothetical protein